MVGTTSEKAGDKVAAPAPSLSTPQGFLLWKGLLPRPEQERLRDRLREALRATPFVTPVMPRSGKEMSVRQSNLGAMGWTASKAGYAYVARHPVTGAPWPAMLPEIVALWEALALYPAAPECCLVNYYGEAARMGMHQDKDEAALEAPVVSVSLGDTAVFRLGRETKGGRSYSFRLESGDVMALTGAARHAFHGVDRILFGSSDLLPSGGRLNLTLRRVSGS